MYHNNYIVIFPWRKGQNEKIQCEAATHLNHMPTALASILWKALLYCYIIFIGWASNISISFNKIWIWLFLIKITLKIIINYFIYLFSTWKVMNVSNYISSIEIIQMSKHQPKKTLYCNKENIILIDSDLYED